MRVVVVQTAPSLGTVERNIARATTLLDQLPTEHLDLIVLPELAFSGYNFTSASHITPFVETLTSSPTREWAKKVAVKRQCSVLAGLPTQDTHRYNTATLVDKTGNIVHEYHKHHMFDTDHRWGCVSGPGFSVVTLPIDGRPVRISVGICMDLNSWEFKAEFSLYEFATYCLDQDVELILLPMAWLLPAEYDGMGGPSMSTLKYWVARLFPLVEDGKKRTVVLCNRTGEEEGAVYAGTSCVFRVGGGDSQVLGVLGREEGILDMEVSLQ